MKGLGVKRPAFWIVFLLLSAGAAYVAIRFFPQAFSIVALEITMDRERALQEARAIMSRDQLGPAGYRQAASFTLDSDAQTFVELEGGGKGTFTSMLRQGLYSAYTWRVRQFKEGETNETTIRFTPEGRPYGFEEKLREDAPGAALDATAAREIAERGAARWNVDLGTFTLVEQGQERRVAGRVDHTLTYERPSPTLNEGRYRVRLVVSGDRLTEVTYFIQIPEAFTRRYASMRSANDAIGIGSVVGMALLYIFGGMADRVAERAVERELADRLAAVERDRAIGGERPPEIHLGAGGVRHAAEPIQRLAPAQRDRRAVDVDRPNRRATAASGWAARRRER